jgi:hypothetical protein
MKTQYKKGEFEITIEGVGQQEATEGNNVVVKMTVELDKNGFEENGKYRFGSRVNCFDEGLRSDWGYKSNNGKHFKTREFSAPTWREAVKKAADYAAVESQKLTDALDARAKALVDAGEWPVA